MSIHVSAIRKTTQTNIDLPTGRSRLVCEWRDLASLVFVCVFPIKGDEAFVTLATNDSYAKGAMVLGQSLRNHNTSRKLVVLVGPHVAEPCR